MQNSNISKSIKENQQINNPKINKGIKTTAVL